MKNKVYVLFQTDIWKTKSSRVCFGVFLYENAAIDAAKENGLYTLSLRILQLCSASDIL